MRINLALIFKLAVVVLTAGALSAAASEPPVPGLRDGATVLVEVQDTVQAHHVHVNDRVRAKVLTAVVSGGRVVIPAGATLVGRVTSAAAGGGTESRLGVRFERAQWKGKFLALNAYIMRQVKRTFRAEDANPLAAGDCASPYPVPSTSPAPLPSGMATAAALPGLPPRGSTAQPAARTDCADARMEDPREPILHASPVVEKAKLRRFAAPAGATELISSRRDIELKKGTVLELRQAESGRRAAIPASSALPDTGDTPGEQQ